ncbi:uncharacterized protein Z520_01767 [Fonsecaea multimorphosa CBS 102226]|uniref:Uncharacterized protein n=1 Tax=Fonsecaea multimorphosa CBS 102226 TaxID=1442371 RepID=A0A0D2KIJ5_9EURO|nr:uncharacterized protein Z520_01767 [Fonsecaea multimorphosa CBS 102226]KIY03300.1 hypothetical protein Z520_01767 [Fonsecaea multimorphosa CBS 102226]OAL30217.1 hypothetical protein AYO22_01733 [Fonsecaea multimorphosa]
MSLYPGEEGDVKAIISGQHFRIITTLKHTLFNAQDADSDSDSADAYALIRRWKDIRANLFALHRRRLREAAEAVGWADVATRLAASPADGAIASGQVNGESLLMPEVANPISLEQLVEDAAARSQTTAGPSFQGPKAGYLRDLRVRVLMSRAGEVTVECTAMGEDRPLSTLTRLVDMYASCPFTPTVAGQVEQAAIAALPPPCQVTIDAQPTHTSLFTRHKTNHRRPYDDARARAELLPTTPPTAREVLLSNTEGQVTEASLSAVYFFRNGTWRTPRSDDGGAMLSVTRLYALEAGWCDEGTVLVREVEDGEVVWLSNAVRGFFPGVVRLHGQRGREDT